MARACVCVKSTLLALGSWYLAKPKGRGARAKGCRVLRIGFWFLVISIWLRPGRKAKTQPRAAVPHECCKGSLDRLTHKEVRVNKKDSPRISREIHIDRKQPLGVSLKGSPLESFGTEEAASGGSAGRPGSGAIWE